MKLPLYPRRKKCCTLLNFRPAVTRWDSRLRRLNRYRAMGATDMRQGQCYHNDQLNIKQLCIPSEAGRDVKYYISQVTIFSLARRLRRFGSNWRLTESIAPSRRSKLESC
ncbi:hypothetical protein HBH64_216480 [Parastagonospora nodorum]|nr:hypothetical protein HBH51_188290 [Parastagonospora nodorum]KAH3962887.1 hypothetical protein HBH52_220960 [Parastagonospora nodorum]KAH3994370.1 hypothetical protein HBI10_187470 [Parastagonospora nodorum]KAH4014247.1 hypothetical protein HBI13_171540 [Parastagonospora nodorum]KAH4022582.1 hypothetical protein HBI09_171490 [Parastagonospora nodorum]